MLFYCTTSRYDSQNCFVHGLNFRYTMIFLSHVIGGELTNVWFCIIADKNCLYVVIISRSTASRGIFAAKDLRCSKHSIVSDVLST